MLRLLIKLAVLATLLTVLIAPPVINQAFANAGGGGGGGGGGGR
ncbi:hypothetical protein Q2941_34595 [Bradyrhizobium sp. UFLA05-153]